MKKMLLLTIKTNKLLINENLKKLGRLMFIWG